MKSYDDLQRFKEKTQTNHIEFKDMAEQVLDADTTSWAIIKQLLNEGAGSVLDNSQLIAGMAPQPMSSAAFTSFGETSALQAPALVPQAAATGRTGASLLDSISASLPQDETVPAAAPQAQSADIATRRAMSDAQQTALSGNSLLAQLAGSHAPAASPAVKAEPAPRIPTVHPLDTPPSSAVDAAASTSFKQLFSTAATPPSSALAKDIPLRPLLEKIASCR